MIAVIDKTINDIHWLNEDTKINRYKAMQIKSILEKRRFPEKFEIVKVERDAEGELTII